MQRLLKVHLTQITGMIPRSATWWGICCCELNNNASFDVTLMFARVSKRGEARNGVPVGSVSHVMLEILEED